MLDLPVPEKYPTGSSFKLIENMARVTRFKPTQNLLRETKMVKQLNKKTHLKGSNVV